MCVAIFIEPEYLSEIRIRMKSKDKQHVAAQAIRGCPVRRDSSSDRDVRASFTDNPAPLPQVLTAATCLVVHLASTSAPYTLQPTTVQSLDPQIPDPNLPTPLQVLTAAAGVVVNLAADPHCAPVYTNPLSPDSIFICKH